jgi:radical SAM superfamily enzyme YgiQ (UPF0313 family)
MFSDDGIYEGVVIRPPSEADSLIFQITLGCSDNQCIFCPAYKEKSFRIKDIAVIENEMQRMAAVHPRARRLFFADGDALVVEQGKLLALCDLAQHYFSALTRISMYGSVKSLKTKTVDDLRCLKEKKLGTVYLGFETGDDEVYRLIRKYGSPEGNIEACQKVKEAGITTNVTVILGLGGRALTQQHALHTAKVLNRAQPHQIAALTLMIPDSTPLQAMAAKGAFVPLAPFEMLRELHALISHLDDFRCLFFANHASNYYPIQARFPADKVTVIDQLAAVIGQQQKNILVPDHLRGL